MTTNNQKHFIILKTGRNEWSIFRNDGRAIRYRDDAIARFCNRVEAYATLDDFNAFPDITH